MNRDDFITHVGDRTTKRVELLKKKGESYSGSGDAFANFKRNAERLGMSKYQIWAVYCAKHLDSIFNAIKRAPTYPMDTSEAEGLQGRIDDAINYLELLSGMLHEDDTRISQGNNEPLRRKWPVDSTAGATDSPIARELDKRPVDDFPLPSHTD
jgi:hypothetical protein